MKKDQHRLPHAWNVRQIARLTVFACGAALISPHALHAQTTKGDGQPGTTKTTAGEEMGEIIVTAQKRSESLSKVGITISAFDGELLKNRNIQDVRDLTAIVPGLTFSQSPSSTPIYTLRGVGYFENALSASPSVSVYLDQVPLAYPIVTQYSSFDLERVEVLKGPQGILFGVNTTGGAINYIAKKPTDKLSAGIDLSYGRFNDLIGDAFVSGPISDTMAIRLSVHTHTRDDWQYSYTRSDSHGKKRIFAGRMLLDWTPSDRLKIEFNLNGAIDNSDALASQFVRYQPVIGGVSVPQLENFPVAPNDPRAADWSHRIPPILRHRTFQTALSINYDLADSLTLTSISSYLYLKRRDSVYDGGTSFENFSAYPANGRISDFYQELRIANGAENRLRATAGGNFELSHIYENNLSNFPVSTAFAALGVDSSGARDRQKVNTYAAFANLDYDVLTDLTVKGGLRYTHSKRDSSGCGYSTSATGNGALYAAISQALTEIPTPPVGYGGCLTLDSVTHRNVLYVASLKEHSVSWRVGADYRADEDTLLYANVARGYKAGSFPVFPASTTGQLTPVKQESLLSYETGVKTRLFDRAVFLTGAAFYYDYRNKQSLSKMIDPIVGLLDALVNVPRSRVYGLETDLNGRLAPGLTFGLSGTYLNSRVKEFVGINNNAQTQDFRGSQLPFTPKWGAAANLDYSWPVAKTAQASIGGSMRYQSSSQSYFGSDPLFRVSSFTTFDVRAKVEMENGISFGLWGKNITNKFYWSNVSQLFDTTVRYAAPGAMYGVTVGAKF